MTILHIVPRALGRAVATPRLSGLLYAVTLLLALPFVLAFQNALSRLTGAWPAMDSLLAGFDFTIFGDVLQHQGQRLPVFLVTAAMASVLFLPVSTFLTGGLLRYFLRTGEPLTLRGFFGDAADLFGRYIRLLLLMAVFALLVAGLFILLSAGLFAWITNDSFSEVTGIFTVIALLCIGSVLMLAVQLIGDYTRVHIAASGERKVLRALPAGFRFVFRNLFAAYGVQLLLLLIPLTGVLLYWWIEGMVEMTSVGGIVLMFLIQQIFMFGRMMVRVAFAAAEVDLYLLRRIPLAEPSPGEHTVAPAEPENDHATAEPEPEHSQAPRD